MHGSQDTPTCKQTDLLDLGLYASGHVEYGKCLSRNYVIDHDQWFMVSSLIESLCDVLV